MTQPSKNMNRSSNTVKKKSAIWAGRVLGSGSLVIRIVIVVNVKPHNLLASAHPVTESS